MNLHPATFLAASVALASLTAVAGPPKIDVCHVNGAGVYNLISVADPAYDSHLNHGDVAFGAFYIDGDGDGFGDAAASASSCPAVGLVDNNLDCDDANSAVSPSADEIEGNGIDDDCDATTPDDPGVLCPCAGMTYQDGLEWPAILLGDDTECTIRGGQAELFTYGDYGVDRYAENVVYVDDGRCESQWSELYEVDRYRFRSVRMYVLSEEEIQACSDDITTWAAAAGLTCAVVP